MAILLALICLLMLKDDRSDYAGKLYSLVAVTVLEYKREYFADLLYLTLYLSWQLILLA